MELDELLALMAAPIYATMVSKCTGMEHLARADADKRNALMQVAVSEARMIWEIAEAEARAIRLGQREP